MNRPSLQDMESTYFARETDVRLFEKMEPYEAGLFRADSCSEHCTERISCECTGL